MRLRKCWRGDPAGTARTLSRMMGVVRGESSVGRRMGNRSMICIHSSSTIFKKKNGLFV
jgi:hypothetical protein